ncbi:tRNA (N6-isopentenyl adenosine(37)-C2)-methylthiotransferase MiaB [Desulfovibrio ferrophilus]|uniref:tRNA-2-methylthio-N(6)-dimethylallyladenosine synthase n=1 Tax=Desulfovibrio ferrophilus TaxID=241368 RepID=A0A2Z6AYK6_9BACT|nr:tRNA (N6-isopentenyl adenosine(37)-C2)-methylthiotransferase MiaB [Desulfovibrio ferrophilus]BBD08342.1 MiaB family RNA modification protein [Desulfovibrio ferrophilus]
MTQDNKTFHIMTFGCQMNVHDSGWLARALMAYGWREAPEDQATALIINTCSVRDKPEQKVYSLVGRLGQYCRKDNAKFVAVGGCVAQQVGEGFFERSDHVRLVFGTDQTGQVPEGLDKLYHDEVERLAMLDFEDGFKLRKFHLPDDGPVSHLPGQAFVNIMQGCDNFCAYCIVPYVRGRQKSRSTEDILAEVRALAEHGVRELTLLGQNVNSFSLDRHGDGTSFAQLLYKVAAIPGIRRLRFTSSHPKDLAPEVINAFGELPNLCTGLHLPMQSGSDRVLNAMGRGYDMARYMGLVEGLRRARPEIALTTDLIVGFPGETEEDFLETLEAVREVGFESSFSFIYSDRPGTRSVRMEPKVEREVAQERLIRLQALQDELTSSALKAQVGTETEVLLESPSKKQDGGDIVFWRGRDSCGRVVNIPLPADDSDLAGKLLTVHIDAAKKHSLMGKAVGEPW